MSTETELDTAIKLQSAEYKAKLETYISANEKSAASSLKCVMWIMILSIISAAGISYTISTIICCYYAYSFIIYVPLLIILLIIIGAILLVTAYKQNLQQADLYRHEQIVLHDLNMALQICLSIPADNATEIITETKGDTENKKTSRHISQQTKVKEQIIEALLNRCT